MRLISIVNYHIFPPNCLSSKFRRIFQLVNLSITIGPDAGNPMMIHCRWYVKANNKYKEIIGVKSSCYQPCIDDVGCQ